MQNLVDNTIFNSIRPLFWDLYNTLSNIFQNVSILAESSNGRNYRHSKSGTTINDNMFTSTGAVIRFSVKGHDDLMEYSFNDFSREYMETIPSILIKHAAADSRTDQRYTNRFEENNTASILQTADSGQFAGASPDRIYSEERLSFNRSTEFVINPSDLSDKDILDSLKSLHQKALNHDRRILDCVCMFQYLTTHKMFISADKDLQQHLLWSNGLLQPLAGTSDKKRYYLQTFSLSGGAELLEQMNSNISYACSCAVDLLDSVVPTPGTYDVICMPDVTGLIAHEAFGHGVEMDMFVKDRALARTYMGQPVASPIVTMHDNALNCMECGSYFFDDEGTLSRDTTIIEKGILKCGISDLLSAARLKTAPTGNGRRESYERKAYARMTNTYFEKGTDRLEDMIASIENGILLENAASGMEDPKNWGIQCMVNLGREIKNGKLTGKIFSPVCLSGYVPDLLKSISMVSRDLQINGCGCCGKGYKEWVKVSDGGPAIKAVVTIS